MPWDLILKKNLLKTVLVGLVNSARDHTNAFLNANALLSKSSLNVEFGGSEEQAKFDFSLTTITVYGANLQKIISYSILIIIVSFLCSN